MLGKRLLNTVDHYLGGKIAVLTAFEPRVLDYRCGDVPRCTWKDLKAVISQVERAALRALILRSGMVDPAESSPDRFHDLGQMLEKNAVALETRTRVPREALTNEENSSKQSTDDEESPSRVDTLGFEDSCRRITKAVDDWLVSFHAAEPDDVALTYKDGVKNVMENALLDSLPAFAFLARLVEIPFLPLLVWKGFYKKDIGMFVHYIKFTIGFTALVCMYVYWDAWKTFELDDSVPEGNVQLISGGPPQSFEGWVLVSSSVRACCVFLAPR